MRGADGNVEDQQVPTWGNAQEPPAALRFMALLWRRGSGARRPRVLAAAGRSLEGRVAVQTENQMGGARDAGWEE